MVIDEVDWKNGADPSGIVQSVLHTSFWYCETCCCLTILNRLKWAKIHSRCFFRFSYFALLLSQRKNRHCKCLSKKVANLPRQNGGFALHSCTNRGDEFSLVFWSLYRTSSSGLRKTVERWQSRQPRSGTVGSITPRQFAEMWESTRVNKWKLKSYKCPPHLARRRRWSGSCD